jgi:hypothetical protein
MLKYNKQKSSVHQKFVFIILDESHYLLKGYAINKTPFDYAQGDRQTERSRSLFYSS